MAEANLTSTRPPQSRRKNLVGHPPFGKLTVQSFHHSDGNSAFWNCLCECGKTAVVPTNSLTKGNTRSCGCIGDTLGGMSMKHRSESHAYYNMIRRCYEPTCDAFKDYGARGITVCDRWRESFLNFFADVGERPSKHHTLERDNNNGNYEPGNVRWATRREQALNTRRSHRITFNGRTQSVTEWAAEIGISSPLLFQRLKAGWSIDRALTTPVNKRKK